MVKVFLVKWFNCINQKENETKFTVDELQAIRQNIIILLNTRIRIPKSYDCAIKEEIKDDNRSLNYYISNNANTALTTQYTNLTE